MGFVFVTEFVAAFGFDTPQAEISHWASCNRWNCFAHLDDGRILCHAQLRNRIANSAVVAIGGVPTDGGGHGMRSVALSVKSRPPVSRRAGHDVLGLTSRVE